MTFKESIDNKNFKEALDLINNGANLLESQFQFKLSDAFPKIIQNKAFDVLNALIENNHIELDIYEYDSFNNTIFKSIVEWLEDDDESISFLENFITQVDSLNDSLGDVTWLSLAFTQGVSPKIAEVMINNGCDINYLNNVDETMLLQTLKARHHKLKDDRKKELITLLIDQGIDVNRANVSKATPLHFVISQGMTDFIDILLENGADAQLADKEGKTAYYMAIVEQRNWSLVEKMATHCPPDFVAEAEKGSSLLFDYLNGVDRYSSIDTQLKFIQFFADYGADVYKNCTDIYGTVMTPVDKLVKTPFEFFESFVNTFSLDVNQADDNGNTILHKVCELPIINGEVEAKDNYRKVKLLLKLGSDASLTNTDDKKPHELAISDNKKEKMVALLLKN